MPQILHQETILVLLMTSPSLVFDRFPTRSKLVLLNCLSESVTLDILTIKIRVFFINNCKYFILYLFAISVALDFCRECIICSIFSTRFLKRYVLYILA